MAIYKWWFGNIKERWYKVLGHIAFPNFLRPFPRVRNERCLQKGWKWIISSRDNKWEGEARKGQDGDKLSCNQKNSFPFSNPCLTSIICFFTAGRLPDIPEEPSFTVPFVSTNPRSSIQTRGVDTLIQYSVPLTSFLPQNSLLFFFFISGNLTGSNAIF